ncbi:hypothetical protein ACI797_22575 [Geodermatophilus sp. SYSU D00691]
MTSKRTALPAVVLAAGVLTGCGQSEWIDQVGGGAPPTDAAGLAEHLREGAADIESAHIELEVSAAGTEITGSGDQLLEDGRAEAFDLTQTVPGVGDIRVVQVDEQTYVQLPEGINPSDRPWLLVSADSSNPLIRELAASLESTRSSSDLAQYTAFAESSTVEVVGEEEVAGAPATHYRLTVDVLRLPNDTPGRADLLSSGLTRLPVDLWVDAEGRPVRVLQEFTVQGQDVRTLVELSDFDEPVEISAPPADEVATE